MIQKGHARSIRMRSRAVVLITASVALTATALAGCSAGGKDGETVTISYLSHLEGTAGPGKDLETKLVNNFMAANPKVKINVIGVESGQEAQKYQILSGAGTPPDVYLSDQGQMPLLLSKQVLAPMDYAGMGYKDAKEFSSKYLPAALKGYSQNDVYYGVPAEFSNYGAWVNTKAYSDAGVAVPTTWSQVCDAGPKLLKKDSSGKVTQQAVVLPTNLSASQVFMVDAVAHENGGSLFSADGKTANLTSEPVKKAFQMVQDLVYKCDASVPTINGSVAGADRTTFGQGVGGMFFTGGSWYLGTLKQQYPKIAPPVSQAQQYPASDSGVTTSTSYGYAWVVAKASKHQDVAWKFIRSLQDAGLEYFKALGLFNGTTAVADSPEAAATPQWSTVWRPSLEKANYAVALQNANQIWDIVGGAFNSIILKQADVASTLQTADDQVKPLLNK